MENLKERIKKIQSLGPSFCLAKWLQVTIDLENGTTHSCHHPKRHKIPLNELQDNPSALHNTSYKKKIRGHMIEGLIPKECSYCFDLEEIDSNAFSDRMRKSTDDWAYPFLDSVVQNPLGDTIPSYLEVMFSSRCQLSCIYCMADISSSIREEMEKFGPYPVRQNLHRLKEFSEAKAENFYLEAFKKWFDKIDQNLEYLRITGGEPFLEKECLYFLERLSEKPHPKLKLAINSNFSISQKAFIPFSQIFKKMILNKSIHSLEFYASIDSIAPQGEYIRLGLDEKLFYDNLEFISKEIPECKIIFMASFNALSYEAFPEFLKKILFFKKNHPDTLLDITPLKNPEYLRPEIFSHFFLDEIKNLSLDGFSPYEIQKIESLLTFLENERSEEKENWKKDFSRFVFEFDKRKGTSFKKVFPRTSAYLDTF